jgi:hypothetical protein
MMAAVGASARMTSVPVLEGVRCARWFLPLCRLHCALLVMRERTLLHREQTHQQKSHKSQ